MKRYNKIFTKMWGVYSLLWDTVCMMPSVLKICSDFKSCSVFQPLELIVIWNSDSLVDVLYFFCWEYLIQLINFSSNCSVNWYTILNVEMYLKCISFKICTVFLQKLNDYIFSFVQYMYRLCILSFKIKLLIYNREHSLTIIIIFFFKPVK